MFLEIVVNEALKKNGLVYSATFKDKTY